MTQDEQKQAAAEAALDFIELGDVVGVVLLVDPF